jgi:hypothetical protein
LDVLFLSKSVKKNSKTNSQLQKELRDRNPRPAQDFYFEVSRKATLERGIPTLILTLSLGVSPAELPPQG